VHKRSDRKIDEILRRFSPCSPEYIRPVGWMIFPQFIPDATLELRDLNQSTALSRLISEAFAPSLLLTGEMFELLARFVRPISRR
jgi:hypothetical protein